MRAEFEQVGATLDAMQHPWFQGILTGELTREQILAGEQQHYLRGRLNGRIFGAILQAAFDGEDDEVVDFALANYAEEMEGPKEHGDLMLQFLESHGMTKDEAAVVEPTPGSLAAISMLTDSVQNMSALEGLAMMSLPERWNADISAAVYPVLRDHYGFSAYAIETYRVHAIIDVGHGDRQLDLLARKVYASPQLKPDILRAIKFGVVAFNYEWDGQYQAATGQEHYHWTGVEPAVS